MFFRNLTFFLFPANFPRLFPTPVAESLRSLETELDECRLKPVGELELTSRGFISPAGRDSNQLTHRLPSAVWITIGGEDRLLPSSVVNDLLAKKLDEIERTEGRKPGGRTRKRLKDELITELMPRAFVSPSRLDAYFDLDRAFIAVDTSSRKAAENAVSEVRRAIGSFPALPMGAQVAPRVMLTAWLAGEPLPEGLSLGSECELRDPADNGAIVRIQREELQGDEVAKHLESGKQCTRLALIYNDHVSFVFGEDLVVRKFKLLDGAVDMLDSTDQDDIRAELDARFALMSGEVGQLFDLLASTFQISFPDPDAAPRFPPVPGNAAEGSTYSGIETVTISSGGQAVTLTGSEFERAIGAKRSRRRS